MSPLFTGDKFGFGRSAAIAADEVVNYDAPGSLPTSQLKNSTVFLDMDWRRLNWADGDNFGSADTTAAYAYDGSTYYIDSGLEGNVDAGAWTFQTDDDWDVAYTGNGGGRYTLVGTNGSPNNLGAGLNTADMCLSGWYRTPQSQRECLISRYGSGFNNQINHVGDPNGNFHYNSSGVNLGNGDVLPYAATANHWYHGVWQYSKDVDGGTMEWYVNGILVWRIDGVGTNSGNGMGISSTDNIALMARGDDWERADDAWCGPMMWYRSFLTQSQVFDNWLYFSDRFGDSAAQGTWDHTKHRYWRYTCGNTITGKAALDANAVKFVTITGTNTKTLVTAASPGGTLSSGTAYTVDFGGNGSGQNSGAIVVGAKIDCSEGSTLQAAHYEIHYSDNNSSWTLWGKGTASNYLDTMDNSSYAASTGDHWVTTGRKI